MAIALSLKKESNPKLKNLKFNYFKIGDVIKLSYLMKYKSMAFKGICIAKKIKSLSNIKSSFILRGTHTNVAVELNISLFNVKIINLEINKYEKKRFFYRKAKLFFLRLRSKKAVFMRN